MNLSSIRSKEVIFDSIVGREPAGGTSARLVRVHFQQAASLVIAVADWVELGLKLGMSVDFELYAELRMRATDAEVEQKALSYLTGRVKTAQHVQQYLLRRGCPEDAVERVMQRLYDKGIVDDEAYAVMFVEAARNKVGQRQIWMRLRQRGVAPEIARTAIAKTISEESQLEAALQCALKYVRRRGEMKDRNDKLRLISHLQQKGFTMDIARKTVEAVEHMDEGPSTPFS
ncbi:SOS response regulatory protein OraA/RecX [Alicyclobacillus sacchari]|uniref:Regulatory protein RecX n=1 Tax=Alicyclobacillus sacchari TaxID=392010 RepID=A0A4R8LSD0_9BACL|nr:RecX family transcriptional regulator [Alicyclobacillus sacchari]TDY50550.1 SOS response regulatory protein OraA/RecX [Alicyclobacillus sacchari]GMA55500.1 regulatory protein RecX [Alicyclobacillus sacchari]GMA59096.1 regulatory protein RecX [Alicyclobacillus sacchari]